MLAHLGLFIAFPLLLLMSILYMNEIQCYSVLFIISFTTFVMLIEPLLHIILFDTF